MMNRESPRDVRQRQLAAMPNGAAFAALLEVLLYDLDPLKVNFEVNVDEYRPEAERITTRLPETEGPDGLLPVLRGCFTVLPTERLESIASAIWQLWQQFNAIDH